MPSKARLDPQWWKANRPSCLRKSAVEKPLSDFAKISRSLEKSGDATAFFKAVSSLKSAISKDQQVAKKANDKSAHALLADLEKLVHQQTKTKQGHLTLKSDVVKGLSGTTGVKVDGEGQGTTVDAIVNGSDKAWQIIKDNKPVGSAKTKSCQAVPKNIPANRLRDWKTEKTSWTCSLKNDVNVAAVVLEFSLQYQWHGQAENASGMFLNDFRVWADVRAPWGYTVNVDARVDRQPFNSGTRDAPVGAVGLLVTVNVATPLKSSTKKWLIICHGNKQREIK